MMNTRINLESLGIVKLHSPQSSGEESQNSDMPFAVYKVKFSSSEACLPELRKAAGAKSFLQDNPRLKSNMVPWYSRRILTLAVFLLLFIILSLVMTGLFIWRALFHDSKNSEGSTVNPSISISQVSCLACSKKAHIFKHQSPFPNGLKIWYASSLFNE